MTPSDPQFDQQMMRRALALAILGRGLVEPNPMVGCVIVKHNRIIGQGYHQRFGQPHAEPNALANCVENGETPNGATAYVTLEPCCHTNKKTPPCVPALIAARLARIVVGCPDPNPEVSGRGIDQLRSAGLQVDVGTLEAECQQLIAPFIAHIVHHRPYVTLKWAQSADGKVAGAGGQRVQISNEHSMRVVHELRSRSDAILVGINTVLADDPLLTARHVEHHRPMIRCVLDTNLRITDAVSPAGEPTLRLLNTRQFGDVWVLCAEDAYHRQPQKHRWLEHVHANVHGVPRNPDATLSLSHVLRHLDYLRITHLLVEPGPTLARSFLSSGLADRVWIFGSPKTIDAPTAPSAVTVPYPPAASVELAGDVLTEYLNPHSPVFFANEPSADFLRIQQTI